MNSKIWTLPLLLAATLSSIYFLPKVGAVAQSAVNMDLPKEAGGWMFQNQLPSEAELQALAADTKFSKAMCFTARPGEYSPEGLLIPDRMDLSIVLSGSDINNSIHRPERCMPAQGHNIMSSTAQTLTLPNGRKLPAKRLVSVQSKNLAPLGQKEQYVKFNCLTYYFFVGHDKVSNDHLGRTFIDIKDRLIRGMDQRWAYVSVSMWYGKVPWIEEDVPESEADEKIRQFLTDFAEKQIQWDQISS